MTRPELTDDDEWLALAQVCQNWLTGANMPTRILEDGLLDAPPYAAWWIFGEYEYCIPMYSLTFEDRDDIQIALCAATLMALTSRVTHHPPAPKIPPNIRTDAHESRAFAIAKLDVDPGSLYIAPVDMWSRTKTYWHPLELDIPGFEEFRLHHKVEADQPALASACLTEDFFDLIDEHGIVYVDIQKGWIIAAYKQPITQENLVALAKFIREFGPTTSDS